MPGTRTRGGSTPRRSWTTCGDDVIRPDEAAARLAAGGTVLVHPAQGRIVGPAGETEFPADLWERIVTIQQGTPVHEDGPPAPDGSCPVTTACSSATTAWRCPTTRTGSCRPESPR